MDSCYRTIPSIGFYFATKNKFGHAAILCRPSLQGLLLQQASHVSGVQAGAVECSQLLLFTVEDM